MNLNQICIEETKKHINQVDIFMTGISLEIDKRAVKHDHSKLQDPELAIFEEYTPKLKNTTYGSEEYNQYLKEMKIALDHHYAKNKHHPEHFDNGIKGMDLIDLIEMFCDWLAATKRHDDGDIYRSIEINQARFKYSDDIKEILKNTAKLMEGHF